MSRKATLIALSLDVVKSSEIDDELLNYDQVCSSIARRLGINTKNNARVLLNVSGNLSNDWGRV